MQVLGSNSAGKSTPAVMVHGLLVDNLASWYFGAAPMLAHDREVIVYDLRGHGRSERATGGYDVGTMAEDLRALIEHQGHPTVDLVGHSYGALVALRLALNRPDLVRRLVLVEAPLPPSRLEELRDFLTADPERLLEALPENLRAALLGGKRRAARAARALQFLLAESSLITDLKAEQDIPDSDLAALKLPVLCVYGARSSCRSVGDRLANALPDAELLTLDGGHYLSVEKAAEVGEAIAAFLRS